MSMYVYYTFGSTSSIILQQTILS